MFNLIGFAKAISFNLNLADMAEVNEQLAH
jgi:hypothetical protein